MVSVNKLKIGDMIDLSSCPYLYYHKQTNYLLFEILDICKEGNNFVIYYDGFLTACYSPKQTLKRGNNGN